MGFVSCSAKQLALRLIRHGHLDEVWRSTALGAYSDLALCLIKREKEK